MSNGHTPKIIEMKTDDIYRRIVGTKLTQLSKVDKYAQVLVNEGIRSHGNKALPAILNEYTQSNDKNVFKLYMACELTRNEKMGALNLITMVKEKHDDKIKGRACTDGRKQRRYLRKDEVSLPTVQLESLMMTMLINAHKCRDVATADVVGAYLLADIKDFRVIKITNTTVEIMCKVNPEYEKYITIEKDKKTLYLGLVKALYRCM